MIYKILHCIKKLFTFNIPRIEMINRRQARKDLLARAVELGYTGRRNAKNKVYQNFIQEQKRHETKEREFVGSIVLNHDQYYRAKRTGLITKDSLLKHPTPQTYRVKWNHKIDPSELDEDTVDKIMTHRMSGTHLQYDVKFNDSIVSEQYYQTDRKLKNPKIQKSLSKPTSKTRKIKWKNEWIRRDNISDDPIFEYEEGLSQKRKTKAIEDREAWEEKQKEVSKKKSSKRKSSALMQSTKSKKTKTESKVEEVVIEPLISLIDPSSVPEVVMQIQTRLQNPLVAGYALQFYFPLGKYGGTIEDLAKISKHILETTTETVLKHFNFQMKVIIYGEIINTFTGESKEHFPHYFPTDALIKISNQSDKDKMIRSFTRALKEFTNTDKLYPSTKWKYDKITGLGIKIFKNYTGGCKGAKAINIPGWSKRAIKNPDNKDNLCFWRCLAILLYQGEFKSIREKNSALQRQIALELKVKANYPNDAVDVDAIPLIICRKLKLDIQVYIFHGVNASVGK